MSASSKAWTPSVTPPALIQAVGRSRLSDGSTGFLALQANQAKADFTRRSDAFQDLLYPFNAKRPVR